MDVDIDSSKALDLLIKFLSETIREETKRDFYIELLYSAISN